MQRVTYNSVSSLGLTAISGQILAINFRLAFVDVQHPSGGILALGTLPAEEPADLGAAERGHVAMRGR